MITPRPNLSKLKQTQWRDGNKRRMKDANKSKAFWNREAVLCRVCRLSIEEVCSEKIRFVGIFSGVHSSEKVMVKRHQSGSLQTSPGRKRQR